jgi:hypothetical protein
MVADPKANGETAPSLQPEGRVLQFRPRPGPGPVRRPLAGQPQPARPRWPEPWEDYYGDESEEHPRRNVQNIVGVGFTLLLIATGLWLAHVLVEMRTIEDCVLSGRTNCAPIEVRSLKH